MICIFDNFFLACGDFYLLLITFANSLDPYQDPHSDLNPNCLTLIEFLKGFFEKKSDDNKSMKITKHAEINTC